MAVPWVILGRVPRIAAASAAWSRGTTPKLTPPTSLLRSRCHRGSLCSPQHGARTLTPLRPDRYPYMATSSPPAPGACSPASLPPRSTARASARTRPRPTSSWCAASARTRAGAGPTASAVRRPRPPRLHARHPEHRGRRPHRCRRGRGLRDRGAPDRQRQLALASGAGCGMAPLVRMSCKHPCGVMRRTRMRCNFLASLAAC